MSNDQTPIVASLNIAASISGAAALIAETLWVRSFSSMVGATVEAAAATFAAFLVGLALGAYLVGGRSDRLRNPLLIYVAVEVGIAVISASVGLGLFYFRDLLIIGGSLTGFPRAVVVFSAVLGLVLAPTLLMGATFPLMVASVRRAGAPVSAVNRLYTLNTLGAAIGTMVCGFLMIRLLGVQGSVLAGSACNLLAAAICLPGLLGGKSSSSNPVQVAATGALSGMREGQHPLPSGDAGVPPIPQWILLLIALGSGLMTLAVEVIWTRLASYFLGNRIYAFSTLLACVLLLLSAGARLSERLLISARRRLPETFGLLLIAASMATLGCGALGGWWIQHQTSLESHIPAGVFYLLWQILKTLILLAPMVVPLGCLFPLSLTAARLSQEKSGFAAGIFYLVNTVGAVAGSLLVGFWSLSEVGTFGSIGLVVAFSAAMAMVVFLCSVPARIPRLAGVLAATLVFSTVRFLLPEQLTLVGDKEELLVRKEDAYGIFQVVRLPDRTLRVTENKTTLVYYLGAFSTSYVQQMQGHLGVFFNPTARRALVLGSGYGITAGALSTYPQLEQIDAVEIIPAMVESADLFMPFNLGYHRNPRVHVVVDDGRHFLARSAERYDIISINVSDPRLPGASSFFHTDFYEIVKRHLNPGGVVLQHAFGTEVRTVLSTLSRSFRYVQMFPAYNNGYNAVAADHPLGADPREIDRVGSAPEVRNALEGIGLLPPLSAAKIYDRGLDPAQYPSLFSEARIASDNHPLLEFSDRGDLRSLFMSNE